MKKLTKTVASVTDLPSAFFKKASVLRVFMVTILVAFFVFGCSKTAIEEAILPLDPNQAPLIIEDNSLQTQSEVNKALNEGKNISYLIDCTPKYLSTNCSRIVDGNETWLVTTMGHIIVDDRVVVENSKKVRRITIYSKVSALIHITKEVFRPEIGFKTIQFFKITTSLKNISPACNLNNYVDSKQSIESIGGTKLLI